MPFNMNVDQFSGSYVLRDAVSDIQHISLSFTVLQGFSALRRFK